MQRGLVGSEMCIRDRLKIVTKHQDTFWKFIQPYLDSDREFFVRFGVVMLLSYYVDEEHISLVLERLDSITHEGYYVKMAVAWAVSVCYVKFPNITHAHLENSSLDNATYNKAIQKICESYRADEEAKNILRGMKRKQIGLTRCCDLHQEILTYLQVVLRFRVWLSLIHI
eukprot:TRINITY_DN5097_c0_g1_i6.p1 TRINITY_DN5097_c0_g1~~TRINITY_DN5097_c0_g1_i6.p1  ORF type:complete len:170 (-),score=25.43 TRINITY_DN5097_c0_g1_i6:146-655(-)